MPHYSKLVSKQALVSRQVLILPNKGPAMKWLKFAGVYSFVLTLIFTLSACSNNKTRVDSKTYQETGWANISTFAWSPDSKFASEKTIGLDFQEIHAKIESSISKELGQRNITLVENTSDADLIITYLGASISRVGMQKSARVYDDSATIGSATTTSTSFSSNPVDYNEGALVVVASDPQTGDDLWQGRAQKNIKVDAGKHKRDRIIEEVIKQIFEEFPIKN